MKRAGFTMIELIFVIVILGILAAVAIPRLAATRNDASGSKLATELATCVNDAGADYLMNENFTLSVGASPACQAAVSPVGPGGVVCYTVQAATPAANQITVTSSGSGAPVCVEAEAISDVSLSTNAPGRIHTF